MKAEEFMHKPVLVATPRASVRDIATQLVINEITGMPVMERNGAVVGVISEADVLAAILDGKALETLTAAEIMSADPVTADVDVSMEDVARMLDEEGIVRVPVTQKGMLVGIISRRDVIRAKLEPEFSYVGAQSPALRRELS